MKKILSILMVLVLMVSISSLALADDDTDDELDQEEQDGDNETEEPDGNESDIDEKTEEETEIMNSSLGAEIRLLQLEKAIIKNIEQGERAVEVLKALNYSTTDLEAILEEMQLLLGEVQAADPNSTDSVQVFVDLKSDARNLTKEFRETIKELLSDAKYRELKQRIQEMPCDGVQNLSKKIQNRIKQFNRNQIHRLYGLIGETNESLAEGYENGTCNLSQVKWQISKMVNHMIKQKKQEMFYELKGEKIKKRNMAEANVENASANFTERGLTRLNIRLQKAEDKGNSHLIQQIQNKIANQSSDDGNGPGNNSNSGNGKGK